MISEMRRFGKLSVLGSLMLVASIFVSSCSSSPEADTTATENSTPAESVNADVGTTEATSESADSAKTSSAPEPGAESTSTTQASSSENSDQSEWNEEGAPIDQSSVSSFGLYCTDWLVSVSMDETNGWTYEGREFANSDDEGILLINGTYNDSGQIIEYQWVNDLGEELVIYTVAQDSTSDNIVLRVEETFQGDQNIVLEEPCSLN